MILWHGSWVLMSKTFFPVWNLDSCSLKPARKSLWFICLSNKQQVWSNIWVFWKKHTACHSLACKPSDSMLSLNQGSNRYGTHTHRTLFPDFFSHGMENCVLGVLLQALKLQGKMILWIWELKTDGKTGFSPVKAGYLQPQTCQKNTLVHFSLHYNNKFCQILEFSERNRWVLPLVGIHLIVQLHLIREKQVLQSILTDQYTWYLFS